MKTYRVNKAALRHLAHLTIREQMERVAAFYMLDLATTVVTFDGIEGEIAIHGEPLDKYHERVVTPMELYTATIDTLGTSKTPLGKLAMKFDLKNAYFKIDDGKLVIRGEPK